MKLIFAGTPDFAVPSLRAAAAGGEVVAVYTQPDRPAGRGRGLQASPVKREAEALGIPVLQPESLRSESARESLRALRPDLMIIVAYGLLLPQKALDIPMHGCWNVHASLLPRWRGAAPIQRAIEAGDERTGVCLMQMEKGLDTGPVLLSRATPIGPRETGGQLHDRLSVLGAEVLAEGLALLREGRPPLPQAQPDHGATYAHKLDKAEARLDWALPAQVLANKVRAFDPWPVAEAELAGERVRVHAAEALPLAHRATPGTLLSASRDGIDVACGEGALRLLRVGVNRVVVRYRGLGGGATHIPCPWGSDAIDITTHAFGLAKGVTDGDMVPTAPSEKAFLGGPAMPIGRRGGSFPIVAEQEADTGLAIEAANPHRIILVLAGVSLTVGSTFTHDIDVGTRADTGKLDPGLHGDRLALLEGA
jgi:methionyl-tRNA formyltransferase